MCASVGNSNGTTAGRLHEISKVSTLIPVLKPIQTCVLTRQDCFQLLDSPELHTYYIRARHGDKHGRIGDARSIINWIRECCSVEEWLVQPMHRIIFGGAGLISASNLWLEGVVGSPTSLLRRGEIAACTWKLDDSGWSFLSCSQSVAERYMDGEFYRGEVTFRHQSVLNRVVQDIADGLHNSTTPFLFEWGVDQEGRHLLLDAKSITIDAELRLVGALRRPPVRSSLDCRIIERPALEYYRVGVRLLARGGAGLSHCSTYSAIDNVSECGFISW